jgi:hypothetical protein
MGNLRSRTSRPRGGRAQAARSRRPPCHQRPRRGRQVNHIADGQIAGPQPPGRELDDGVCAHRRGGAPRPQIADNPEDSALAIDEDHVDREPHERRVNRAARRQEERGLGVERVSAKQSAPPRRPGGRQFHGDRDGRSRPSIHECPHFHLPSSQFRLLACSATC